MSKVNVDELSDFVGEPKSLLEKEYKSLIIAKFPKLTGVKRRMWTEAISIVNEVKMDQNLRAVYNQLLYVITDAENIEKSIDSEILLVLDKVDLKNEKVIRLKNKIKGI